MTNPLKVIKYCPRCGSDKFHPDSDRSFICQFCRFHFFINSAAAVAVLILNDQGELLLTERALDPNKGMLDLPGGFVDPGECLEEAVKRELLEELNLEVDSIRYLISFPNEYVFSGYTVYTVDLAFTGKVRDFSNIESNDDVAGFQFIHPQRIEERQIFSDSIRKIIDYYRNNR